MATWRDTKASPHWRQRTRPPPPRGGTYTAATPSRIRPGTAVSFVTSAPIPTAETNAWTAREADRQARACGLHVEAAMARMQLWEADAHTRRPFFVVAFLLQRPV